MGDHGFLAALREAVGPAHKSIAMMLSGDDASPDAAQSRLSRILAGELNLPPALLVLALRGPNPGPLHEWIARVGRVEVVPVRQPAAALRERAVAQLVTVAEQLELIRSELSAADEAEADEAERAPLARVRTAAGKGVRRA